MRREKRYLYLDDYEYRLAVAGILEILAVLIHSFLVALYFSKKRRIRCR